MIWQTVEMAKEDELDNIAQSAWWRTFIGAD
jgi:hypothetical protein